MIFRSKNKVSGPVSWDFAFKNGGKRTKDLHRLVDVILCDIMARLFASFFPLTLFPIAGIVSYKCGISSNQRLAITVFLELCLVLRLLLEMISQIGLNVRWR